LTNKLLGTRFYGSEGRVHRSHSFDMPGFHFHRTSIGPFRRVACSHFANQHVAFATLDGQTVRSVAKTDGADRRDVPDFAGAISFIPATHRHVSVLDVGHLVCGYIAIEPDLIEAACGRRPLEWATAFNLSAPKLHRHIAVLNQLVAQQDEMPRAALEGVAYSIVRAMGARFGNLSRRRDDSWLDPVALKRVLEFVECNLSEDLYLSELAREAGLGPSAFLRAFRGSTGVSPGRYIQERRIARAREMLRFTAMPVSLIARALGFTDSAHFANSFRKWQGCSPRMYRSGCKQR
jgi:AraC-like DNA-binding protein